MPIKVAITGCLGYTGIMLTKELISLGYDVIGVDSCMYGQDYLIPVLSQYTNFTFHKLDIRNSYSLSKLLEDCDVVYFLAALVGAPVCDKLPLDVKDVNFYAVQNYVKYAPARQRIIYPNTNSGYGIGGEELCTEESPLNPISSYGKTKCEAEKCVLDRENTISLRLATVFGMSFRPRFDLMVNNWTAKLMINKGLDIFEGHFRRNFLNIQDLTRVYLWFMEDQHRGAFNVGSPTENLTKMELALKLADLLHLNRKVVTEGKGEDPDKRNYLVDNSKLLKTGFRFKHSLEDGVRDIEKYVNIIGKAALKMGNV